MKLSVIIPMYNEASLVQSTLQCLTDYLSAHFSPSQVQDSVGFTDYELIAVNDGSTDATDRLLTEAAAADPRILVIRYAKNQGKGYAVRRGMLAASGAFRIFTDCDLAYGTDVLGRMAAQHASTGADLILGSRNLGAKGHEGYSFLRRCMSKSYFAVIRRMTGFSYTDSQSGCKGFSASAAEAIFPMCEISGFAFDLEAILLAEKLGFSIAEMPVRILHNRQNGSKIRPLRDARKMLSDIRRIRKRIAAMDPPAP